MNTKIKSAIVGTIISLISFCSSESHSQNWQWGQLYGGNGQESIIPFFVNAANEVYVSGSTDAWGGLITPNLPSLRSGPFFSKITSGGNVVWTKDADMTGNFYMGGVAKSKTSEEFYMSGTYNGSVTFGNNIHTSAANENGVFVSKYDANADLYWASTSILTVSGGSPTPLVMVNNMVTMDNGNFVVCGTLSADTASIGGTIFTFTNNWNWRAFAILCDSTGAVINKIIYPVLPGIFMQDDEFRSVQTDAQQNIYVLGLTNSYQSITTVQRDLIVMKFDSTLQSVWTRTMVTSDDTYGGFGGSLTVADNGEFYIAGNIREDSVVFSSGTIQQNPGFWTVSFVSKYNSSGTEQWAIPVGGSISGLLIYSSQDIYISGVADPTYNIGNATPTGTIFLARYSNSGNFNNVVFSSLHSSCPIYPSIPLKGSTGEIYLSSTIRDSLTFGNLVFHNTTPTPGSCPLADAVLVKYQPDVTAGINSLNRENDQNNFVIYPNPNNGQFNVNLNSKINCLRITNIVGEVVYSIDGNVLLGQKSIDVSSLSSGTYFVTIVADEKSSTEKMVIH